MTIKGKRAKITKEGKSLILKFALERTADGNRKQRTILAEELQKQFERRGWDVPEIEVLERKISWYRNHAKNPLDKHWNLGKITERDLPIESIPVILGIQEYRRLKNKEPLTIRQAWWLSRIYSVIPQPKVLSISEVLYFWARDYAAAEQIAELPPTGLDTSDLDRIVSNYSEEYAAYPATFDEILERGTMGIDDIGSTLNYILKLRKLVSWIESLPEEERAKYEDVEKNTKKYISYSDFGEKVSQEYLSEKLALGHLLTQDEMDKFNQAMEAVTNYFIEHPDEYRLPEEDRGKIIHKIVEPYKQKEA